MNELLKVLLSNNIESIEALTYFIEENYDLDVMKEEVEKARTILAKYRKIGEELEKLYRETPV